MEDLYCSFLNHFEEILAFIAALTAVFTLGNQFKTSNELRKRELEKSEREIQRDNSNQRNLTIESIENATKILSDLLNLQSQHYEISRTNAYKLTIQRTKAEFRYNTLRPVTQPEFKSHMKHIEEAEQYCLDNAKEALDSWKDATQALNELSNIKTDEPNARESVCEIARANLKAQAIVIHKISLVREIVSDINAKIDEFEIAK
ncbi:hypothetical protein TERTU_1423 [Teredinibacter turnerae T7901]|uniref:Uncharacterized protein n=1 Tax=Teredinibacter turnerae (strain ATCC 39867 / T7901) TaxID=377629 RepID=C5BSM6_TERTT|nr:hypothetical protein [Teredinibacter turnerae]ACR14156.1 hypothetical protein TERTU_1423 [Teredinibacter turnerae T7901]